MYFNTIGNGNVAIGKNALFFNSTGNTNVAIGQSSMSNNTIGFNNLGIGNSSLSQNVNGISNIAIGASSLELNVSGSNNTAIGVATLTNNRGSDNTGIGYQSLYQNTIGTGNLAIGNSSLLNNVTGFGNLAIGPNAGQYETGNEKFYLDAKGRGSLDASRSGSIFYGTFNSTVANQTLQINAATDIRNNLVVSGSLLVTDKINNLKIWTGSFNGNSIGIGNTLNSQTGSSLNNIAIGDGALSTNVTGANVVAIGNGALQNSVAGFNLGVGASALNANTTGEYNVGIGQSSNQANTIGSNNTSIGYNTMVNNTTGSTNTAIGAQALQNNISGSGNVAIGNSAGYHSISSNEFFVGNQNYGGINTERSGSIFYGTFNGTPSLQTLQINAGQVRLPLIPNSTGSFFVMQDATGSLSYATPQQAILTAFAAGAFYSTGSVTATANVSGSFVYNSTVDSQGVTYSGSQITVSRTGLYNIQFSTQIDNGSGAADVAIWLKKNGSNIADTATVLTVPSNHKDVLALNLWDNATAGDYYELTYQSDSSNTSFATIAASGNIPRSPGIIVTVNQVR
jgi:hypothetical protein